MPEHGVQVKSAPLMVSGQVKVDLDNRVVIIPVRGRLDLTIQTVLLPLHFMKALTAQIITAEAQLERQTLEQAVKPAMRKVETPDLAAPA